MTPDLQHRFDRSMPPFDGVCVHNHDESTLAQLREILNTAITELATEYPTIESFRDWHEHDGFIVDSKTESWDTLRTAVQTDRTLFDSRDDECDVCIAVCPTSYDWLLRYNIDQDDESDYTTAICDFDLSVAKQAATSNITSCLLLSFPNLLVEHESRLWFKSNYGG